jgi:transcription elongation factor SPT5
MGGEDYSDRRAAAHQRFDTRQRELSDAELAKLAADVEQRYRQSAASVPYSGDMNSIPQRLLMPSVKDASLWQVKVKVGSATLSHASHSFQFRRAKRRI